MQYLRICFPLSSFWDSGTIAREEHWLLFALIGIASRRCGCSVAQMDIRYIAMWAMIVVFLVFGLLPLLHFHKEIAIIVGYCPCQYYISSSYRCGQKPDTYRPTIFFFYMSRLGNHFLCFIADTKSFAFKVCRIITYGKRGAFARFGHLGHLRLDGRSKKGLFF